MTRQEVLLAPTDPEKISRRDFLIKLGIIGVGTLIIGMGGGIVGERKSLEDFLIKQRQLEILPWDQDPISTEINTHNTINLNPEEIKAFLKNYSHEATLVLPFPLSPFDDDNNQIKFIRKNIPLSYAESLNNGIPTNYVTFSGLKKGSIFRSPIEGKFVWSEGAKHEPEKGIFLQSSPSERGYIYLLLAPKEKIETLVGSSPIPVGYRGDMFSSETATYVSLGQPLFRLASEKNISGPNYQIDMLGLLFKPIPNQTPTPLDLAGQYFYLDIHFLWAKDNKILVMK